MTKILDIIELVRTYENTKDYESMGNYNLIVNSVDFLLEYRDFSLVNKENIYGIEAIYDKIKVSIEKLADELPKTIKRTDNFINEHIDLIRKNMNILEDKYPEIDNAIKEIDKDSLGEIKLTDVLPYDEYQNIYSSIYSIFAIENEFAKDILKGNKNIVSKQMKSIISICEKMYIDINEDPMENSGYSLNVSKEYSDAFIKKKISLKELGYDKKKIQSIYVDLKNHNKEVNKKYKKTLVGDIKKVSTSILTDFNKLRNKNVEVSAKKIITTTIQLCRCYFYLKLLVELYNVIAWGPFYSSINILETLVKDSKSDLHDAGDSLLDNELDEEKEEIE